MPYHSCACVPVLAQLPSCATFPPRTTELTAAPMRSCAQYRPAPYFRSGLPAVCRLQPQLITTYTWTATHLLTAALQTPGLAYTRTALQSQRHSLSLWSTLVSSLQLPVGVSVPELVSLVLHSVSPTGASPVSCVSTVSVCTMSMVPIYTCFDHTYSVVAAVRSLLH